MPKCNRYRRLQMVRDLHGRGCLPEPVEHDAAD
jgi:hypothetical protein